MSLFGLLFLLTQTAQHPLQMLDRTRVHFGSAPQEPAGRHVPLSMGTLFVPSHLDARRPVPLVIHFHGEPTVTEQAALSVGHSVSVLTVQLGADSDAYAGPFVARSRYQRLLEEVSEKLRAPLGPVTLSGFSAGYGAVREILKSPQNWNHVDGVVLADGMHASYWRPEQSSAILAAQVQPFVAFAREAAAGHKRMLVTHSEITPGTYASTTETANFLLDCLGLPRRPVVRWGPVGMQQLSGAQRGQFQLLGFAGHTGADHMEHLQALDRWWQMAQVWR